MIAVRTATASDGRRVSRIGTTASGLASAVQVVDVTPFTTITIGQSAVAHPLIILKREGTPSESNKAAFLTEDDDPVLAQLWDNDDDAVFDRL